jgi:hypothetical protein
VEEDLPTIVPDVDDPIAPIVEFIPEHQIKRMYLKASDARKRGLWPMSCPGCRSNRDSAKRQGHTDKCRDSIEKLLKDGGDPRFVESYARMATQMMAREQGEKREAEEEEEEKAPAKRPRTREEGRGSASSSGGVMIEKRTSGDDDASEVPMVREKKDDNDGDAIMHINLDKHFKVISFDKVDYFNESEVNEVKQALRAKKFGATIYHEEVIKEVIGSSK